MARRIRDSEIEFGSDSFLDIVANIVGILIILIVVAGVRVSQAPIAVEAAAVETEPPSIPLPAPDAQQPREPSPQLVRRAEELGDELAALDAQAREQQLRASQLKADAEQIQLRQAQVAPHLEQATERLAQSTLGTSLLGEEVKQAESELAALFVVLDQTEQEQPTAKQVTHRLTPLSQTVEGDEIHFRLAEGRVALVPIDEFIERLQVQIERQKDWLIKARRHQGTVGPIGGFTMEYLVERQPLSAMDQLRLGGAYVRIGVTQWQLIPQPELVAETAQQALRPGSRFFLAMKSAERDTAVTLWVYPDSFELYRRLQEFAHAEGFTVAARPLPFGVPIAGSPGGSKSSAQ